MPREKAPTPPAGKATATARTVRELAKNLGRSHTAVNRWLKDDRWPFGTAGPWDVEKAREWAARTLTPPAAEPGPAARSPEPSDVKGLGPERRAKLAITLERAATIKFNRELQQGLYHHAGECKARRVRQIQVLKNDLLQLPESLPCDDATREVLRGRVLQLLRTYAGGAGAAETITEK